MWSWTVFYESSRPIWPFTWLSIWRTELWDAEVQTAWSKMYRCSNSTMNETSCLHQVAGKGISRWGFLGTSVYPSWNKGGIWKVFYSVISPLEQRGKMTLIEKVNFWLLLVQRILPATESGPHTRATSMPMDSQLGVCQKTSTWLRGTWSREILVCP